MTQKHTPLPYKTGRTTLTHSWPIRRWCCELTDAQGNNVASAWGETQEEAEANAAFIFKACNSHYELLEALKLSEPVLDAKWRDWCFEKIERKAEAKTAYENPQYFADEICSVDGTPMYPVAKALAGLRAAIAKADTI